MIIIIILRKLEYCFFNGSKSGQWFRRAAFLALAVYSILHPQVSFSDSISNFQFLKFCLISKRWRWQWRWRWRWRFTQTRWAGFRLRTTHVRKAVLPTKADTFWRNVLIRWTKYDNDVLFSLHLIKLCLISNTIDNRTLGGVGSNSGIVFVRNESSRTFL